MTLFYAIICRFVPKKLVAFCIVYHLKENDLPVSSTEVYELFDKIAPELA